MSGAVLRAPSSSLRSSPPAAPTQESASRDPDVRGTQLHWTVPPVAARIGCRQRVSSLCLQGRGGPSQVAKLGRTAPGVSTRPTSCARRSVGFSGAEASGGHVLLLRGSPAALGGDPLHLLPVRLDGLLSLVRQLHRGDRLLALEVLTYAHQPCLLQLGQVVGEVPFAKAGEASYEQVVGAGGAPEDRQYRQAGGLVDHPIEGHYLPGLFPHDLSEFFTHRRLPPAAWPPQRACGAQRHRRPPASPPAERAATPRNLLPASRAAPSAVGRLSRAAPSGRNPGAISCPPAASRGASTPSPPPQPGTPESQRPRRSPPRRP